MLLQKLFAENPNIVINTDIDGILSGLILVENLGCKIVGFSNSRDTVWLADDYNDLYKNVYIDMFVTDDSVYCIDQHVVAINDDHRQKIVRTETKINPQIEDNCLFTNKGFENKYPFGTTLYIIALLEAEGITIKLPKLDDKIPKSKIKVGDLIHRADDAMRSTLYAYTKNSKKWWDWLKSKSNNAQSINDLYDYLLSIPNQNGLSMDGKDKKMKNYITKKRKQTESFFKKQFSCSKSDGDFKNIIDSDGNILIDFYNYVTTIGQIMNCQTVIIPNHYITHKGKAYRTRWLDDFEDDFMNDYLFHGHKIFSYAFVYGPGNDLYTNWSFTVDMQ